MCKIYCCSFECFACTFGIGTIHLPNICNIVAKAGFLFRNTRQTTCFHGYPTTTVVCICAKPNLISKLTNSEICFRLF
ncbi:AciNPV91 [Apocheima cinerarium nucleopolyhedrovirus]|uniref:AciNPV91 n=1 Tax=Apocheima cinerarium nucleopolyhedrovirus TaxID=307461 RepID=UPI0001D920BF|nr:AciNPV91 [Apocheima cinerarium nucleopolyhedrovirus]ADB84452.1 AciNPV91 [Apocheima cinerarium nucleopolyhedrovirus]